MQIIKIPPMMVIIALFALKKEVRTFNDEPNRKKVVEIPKVKNNVLRNSEFLLIPLLFISSRLLFDSILKYTGKIGNIHGDKKEISPSKKTTPKLKFSIKLSLIKFFLFILYNDKSLN